MHDDQRPEDRPDDLPREERPAGAGDASSDAGAAPATSGPTTPETSAGAPAVPDEDELRRVATPAAVRRAPRYRAFVVAGALIGMVVAVTAALVTSAGSGVTDASVGVLPFLDGQNGVRGVMALTGVVLGGLLGGAVAVVADRRSVRRRRGPDQG